MIDAPTRIYAYEVSDNVSELESKSARRLADGWEILQPPRISQVRVVKGDVHVIYRQEYLKFASLVSPAGLLSA